MTCVIYNPLAHGGRGEGEARKLAGLIDGEICWFDITAYEPEELIKLLPEDAKIVLAGGDGTINRLVNLLDRQPERDIYYFPAGSGNDFMADVKERESEALVRLNPYLEKLPTVTVNGVTRRFINGVGYGIDGYCCEEGDALREKGKANINYTAIAIKGLLFHFRPRKARVTVDGVEHGYKNVWLAPAMNGRFYGGGMMVAPAQDRLNAERTLSVVVLHCPSKLKTLVVFPSIFKGEHVKHTEMTEVLVGKEIRVEFDRPTALQIDGETVKNVRSYTARSAAMAELSAAAV